jgi:PadR family transcriptional regulator PadR
VSTRSAEEAALLVLAALAPGSQHGFGLIGDVERLSGGRVQLRVGTLYNVLNRLRALGLIGVERQEITGRRLRRYYQIATAVSAPPLAAATAIRAGTSLRVADSDRDATAAALREHFARGRITLAELDARVGVALTATTRGELLRATRDLPPHDYVDGGRWQ